MNLDTGKRSIDFLLRNAREADEISLRGKGRQVELQFWGGEPLIEWPLLKDLVHYAKKASKEIPVRFGGTTNGTLFTPDKFTFLKENQIHFVISFDGTPQSHDTHRRFRNGGGSHATIARNIEAGLKIFPGLRVRMSPFAEGIDRFYEDVAYIIALGIRQLMFSPVYESGWTAERWQTFDAQCQQVTDLLLAQRGKGDPVEIEHYKSYAKSDSSHWPCGAGRTFVGIDVDGSIYPCHRFIKFNDARPWHLRPTSIGHIDFGITNPEFRKSFIDRRPTKCNTCGYDKITPCHGGCYAVNYDLTGHIATPPEVLCRSVEIQSTISRSYREKFGPKGFPEAVHVPPTKPSASGIMAVVKQMEARISALDKVLSHDAN
jgi:uncharacterized protein